MTTQSPTSQFTRSRGGRDPRSVELNARSDGSFGALSSNGVAIYTVRLSPPSCTCKGFGYYQRCCHVTAAQQARTCLWCGHVGADIAVYANGWDKGAELALCPACLTPEVM
jgi:hypothetical protein